MKQFYNCLRIMSLLCLLQWANPVLSQTLTARANTSVYSLCNGFYEYLPQGYTTSKKYPLLISYHGAGEDGDGSPGQLSRLLNTGMPALIKNGHFPNSFTSNGQNYQFIVIMPQFTTNPFQVTDSVYLYAISHYSVDLNRVYLSGYSQGGGNIENYISDNPGYPAKIAAVVPVAGSVSLNQPWAQVIASSNLPILATHNINDNVISVNTSINNINLINNSTPPPTPLAQLVVFTTSNAFNDVNQHGGWDYTFNPSEFTFNGLSIYEWMLQYTRNLTSSLPVTLGSYTAQLSGPSAVSVKWNTVTEINNSHFSIERSADGSSFNSIGTVAAANDANGHSYSFIDNHPLTGKNYYRLSQTDIDGKTTYFNVLEVTVTPVSSGLHISPNPVSSYIQLELVHPETGDLHVVLSDMQGRVLQTWKFTKQDALWQQSLQIGNLPAGNYTIQIKGTTIREVQQFMKQ